MVWQKELEEEEAVLDMDDGNSDTKDRSRMLRDEVTPDDIASVVASWTGDCVGPEKYQMHPDSSPPKTNIPQLFWHTF